MNSTLHAPFGPNSLDVSRVSRHSEAKIEIEDAGEDIARHHDRWPRPDWVLDRIVHGFEEVGRANNRDERRVHKQANEIVYYARQHQGQRLRQYDEARHGSISQSERHRGFILSSPQRLKITTYFF